MLSDKLIRQNFIISLKKSRNKPQSIVQELAICNGGARADIVAFQGFPHSYEIKSDIDRLDRLPSQISFYDYTFKKNTVITTERFSEKVESMIPEHWGIILAYQKKNHDVCFKQLKVPKVNKNWAGDKALLTLWKQELLSLSESLLEHSLPPTLSRAHIAKKLYSDTKKNELQKAFFYQLNNRFLVES